MGRRSSFGSIVTAIARDAARASRPAETQRRRQFQASIRYQKATERDLLRAGKEAQKEAKQQYLLERQSETERKNSELLESLNEIRGILNKSLKKSNTISFDSLKVKDEFPQFVLKGDLSRQIELPVKADFLSSLKEPGSIKKILPGIQRKYEDAKKEAEENYLLALQKADSKKIERDKKIERAKQEYENEKAAFVLKNDQRNSEVDELSSKYKLGDPDAIVAYCSIILERSEYPEDFPQEFRIAYVPESKELVIEYELPIPGIVPKVAEYRYTKSKDNIEEKPRKDPEIKDLYQDIVASITLRTCHELFESDQGDHLSVIVFNGFVQTIDVATGSDIRPYLISIRTTKEKFIQVDLSRIDKKACLRNLGASISSRPDEVLAIKPIVEFDMVDKRFVEESDILSGLDSHPNLMELNPFEFENLVSNLFKQLGLETKLTRSSRDGGVDVVAFDVRPVIGGKVVIQAKRYKNTVGVSAVRDLYGTMMNEGANKGILVTTSGYGPDAFEFSKDKPIELLDGGKLLYLLDQVGVKARIIFPEDWKDN
jgi:restriction system protein